MLLFMFYNATQFFWNEGCDVSQSSVVAGEVNNTFFCFPRLFCFFKYSC